MINIFLTFSRCFTQHYTDSDSENVTFLVFLEQNLINGTVLEIFFGFQLSDTCCHELDINTRT